MNTKNFIWKYKDANRVYWRLEVERERADVTRCMNENHDDPDHWWTYKLINEDNNTVIASGEVWGQYDLVPDINHFLADIQTQFAHLCLGMAFACRK